MDRAHFYVGLSPPEHHSQVPLRCHWEEEQDLIDTRKGKELARVMMIVMAHGTAYGCDDMAPLSWQKTSTTVQGAAPRLRHRPGA